MDLQGRWLPMVNKAAVDRVRALHSLGGSIDPRRSPFVSHLLIGVKGARPGTAIKLAAHLRLGHVVGVDRRGVYGMKLAEYHSGYMLYSARAQRAIPFLRLSDTFHFDGEMLFMAHRKGLRIVELPIPTHYGDEKSHLRPIRYGFDVLGIMFRYLTGKYDL